MAVWTVKGGRHGEREDACLERGVIGGRWDNLSDLSTFASPEDLKAKYTDAYPNEGKQAVSNHVGQLWSLVHRMQEGELVVLPLKTTGTVAVGRLTGSYQYRDDLGEALRHVRPVKWIATDIPRDAFDQDLLYSFGAFLTFGRVKRDQAEERILAAIKGERLPIGKQEAEEEVTTEDEEALDVQALAREEVRQFITRGFAGHELARLVGTILSAQEFSVTVSPPGADEGVDILAGSGPMGLDNPRIVVQVKTGQAGVDEFRSLRGLVNALNADQGLLVAWRGFKGTVRSEARREHFLIRLWDNDDLLDALFAAYDDLAEDIRSKLPLHRVWALVRSEE